MILRSLGTDAQLETWIWSITLACGAVADGGSAFPPSTRHFAMAGRAGCQYLYSYTALAFTQGMM